MPINRTTGRQDRRRGFALLLSVLLITLLIATSAELVTVSSTQSIVAGRRHSALAHELAVDSALLLLADRLLDNEARPSELVRSIDERGQTSATLTIGPVKVNCALFDDAAKLNPLPFQRDDQPTLLTRKLTTLAQRASLPNGHIDLKPILIDRSRAPGPRYRWFDQLLSKIQPGSLFRWSASDDGLSGHRVWSDVLTFWGDGRIDLRRVDEPILEAALEDIRPGLARIILSARKPDRNVNFMRTALIGVDAEIRQRVAARLAFDVRRYAIRMDTSKNGDRRRWYIVATIKDRRITVHHRSQLTW